MELNKARILIAEDESIIALDLKSSVRSLGYEVVDIVASGKDAVSSAREKNPDLVLMDISLPGEMDGIEACGCILNALDIPVIYITAHTDTATFQRAQKTNPYGYLIKPIGINDLYSAMEMAVSRYRLECKLRESEEKYRALVENINEVIITTDTEGRFTYVSPVLERVSGYRPEELLGKNFSEFIHPGDLPGLLESRERTYAGISEPYDYRVITKDGTVLHVRTSSRILEKDGKVLGLTAVLTDITAQKHAERALAESEKRLRYVMEATNDGLYDVNLTTGEIHCNDRYYTMLGYAPYEIPPSIENWATFLHDDDRESALKLLSDHLEGKTEIYESIYQIKTKFGQWKWILDRAKVMERDASGMPLRLTGTHVDISHSREAAEELNASMERYRSLYNNTPVMLHSIDRDGRIMNVSDYWLLATGYGRDEVIGRRSTDFLSAESRRQMETIVIPELFGSGQCSDVPVRLLKKNGQVIDVLLSSTAERNAAGEVTGSLSVMTDITERKKAEEQIRTSLVEKEILLREVHHRVKNNFQVITSLLNLQAAQINNPAFLGMFQDSQNRIRAMSIIHEKLYQSSDLAQIDFKGYIDNLIRELQTMYISSSRMAEIQIDAEEVYLGVDQAVPCGLILNELVTNSFKHAFPPDCKRRAVIRISLHAHEDGRIELSISDNGKGLPAEINLQDPATLGLTLAFLLASQLKGELTAGNGQGTSFILRFNRV